MQPVPVQRVVDDARRADAYLLRVAEGFQPLADKLDGDRPFTPLVAHHKSSRVARHVCLGHGPAHHQVHRAKPHQSARPLVVAWSEGLHGRAVEDSRVESPLDILTRLLCVGRDPHGSNGVLRDALQQGAHHARRRRSLRGLHHRQPLHPSPLGVPEERAELRVEFQ